MYQRRKGLQQIPLELGGVRYTEWKTELVTMELYILKELGFFLYDIMDHPHKYILYYVKILEGSKELSQKSWNYLNDSLRLDLNLRFNSQEIACAAIYMSARVLQYPLPMQPPWWCLMTDNFDNVITICECILGLYELPKVYECTLRLCWC